MKKLNGKIALILGIISVAFTLIMCNLPIIIIGSTLGVLTLILGIINLKNEKEKSITAIILGACSILIAIVWLYMYLIA